MLPLPSIPGISSGEVEKMQIQAFSDSGRSAKIGDPFFVMFNPSQFQRRYEVEYCEVEELGRVQRRLVYKAIPPQQFNFEFLFDGTGASDPVLPGGIGIAIPGAEALFKPETVDVKIKKFLDTCGTYVGTQHRPPYLTLCWGTFIYQGVLVSADVTYTLFTPNGVPLRAKVKASFQEDDHQTVQVNQASPSSPDLTHERTVNEFQNLPLMTDEVYDDVSYYLQVAQFNKLKHFRRLKTGQQLRFPPIKSQNS